MSATTGPVPGPEGPVRKPARRRTAERKRLVPLVLVVATLTGVGIAAAEVAPAAGPAVPRVPVQVASLATPGTAQSSAWYCPGSPTSTSGGGGVPSAQATLLAVNPGRRPLGATLHVVDAAGASVTRHLVLAAHGETGQVLSGLVPGRWLASRLVVDGGGVVVSERLEGAAGWTVTPCATETSSDWYFAQGSTAGGSSLAVSLYNPTPNLAVADLTFYAGATVVQPDADQGIVVPPGGLVTAEVGPYVQDRAGIATVVSSQSPLVAAELQTTDANGVTGLSLGLGAPALERRWDLPRAVDVGGGTSAVAVFNPTAASQRVSVEVTLPSGRVAPFVQKVAAHTTWTLATSQQVRIPLGDPWSASVRSSGDGVVVERVAQGPDTAGAPEWAAASAVPSAATGVARRWIVPGPLASGEPAIDATGPFSVAVQDTGRRAVRVRAYGAGSAGPASGRSVTIEPGTSADIPVASQGPVQVVADGPVAVAGDASDPSDPGLLVVPAVPQT